MFDSPCPYAPLSTYDWKLVTPYAAPPGCANIPWNPLVIALDAALQACTIWIGIELNVQLFLRFKSRNSVYFW